MFYVYAGMGKYQILSSILKVNPNLPCFVSIYNELIIHMSEFKPELILVSTGFLSVFFVGTIVGVNNLTMLMNGDPVGTFG